ncbi:MAG: radical SAM protein [Candidatus Woesearchaeota archaeon]
MQIEKTKFHSWKIGQIAKGCELCVKGQKLVLFVTGVCGQDCFFCPLSEQKKNRDVIYANEWPITTYEDIITEAKLTEAKGAGITGGDPLLRLARTVEIIKLLKESFGRQFHIHLYTPLTNISWENLKELHLAGLDEIRFHPELDNKAHWERITFSKRFDWDVGIEIPALPGFEKQTLELIDFVHDKIDFLNLNELEISSTNAENLAKLGYYTKNEVSYGVKGSEELAMKLLGHCEKLGLKTHYCTTTLKDKEQLAKRILRRAKNVARKFDKITGEGMLIRGAVYLNGLEAGFNYRDRITKANKKEAIVLLNALKVMLTKRFSLSHEMTAIDEIKLRLLTSESIARRIAGKIDNKCAVVEEYPTYDQFEIEVEIL